MKVLVSGHGEDRAALDAARRAVAHRRLILFTSKPESADLATMREVEHLAGVVVEVHAVDPTDLLACLRDATAVLEREAQNEVHVHVAGGPNLVTSALLLAAFQRGSDAFFCHPKGISRLPVIFQAQLTERFNEADRALLGAIPEDEPAEVMALASPELPITTVRASLLRLRKIGAVTADHQSASLTATGRYYREHLQGISR